MNRIVACIFVASVAWLTVDAQQPLSNLFKNDGDTTLRGRIVLYDWAAHETTSGDDFVVKTTDSNMPYARVIYKPFWGFDAPPMQQKDRLDRLAFVGRGTSWSFAVHQPQSVEEKAGCSSRIVNHKYEDESGSGEIPRFIPTPGAATEQVPSLQSLPCFILKHEGLTRLKSDNETLKSGTVSQTDTVDPATGNLHLTIPLVATAKPR